MSRFIYLVVLKCTGRTCNAHPVIGGDVVASSWYVYSLMLYFLSYFLSFLVNIHENHTHSVCFDYASPRGSFFLPNWGWGGGGGGPFQEYFVYLQCNFYMSFYKK